MLDTHGEVSATLSFLNYTHVLVGLACFDRNTGFNHTYMFTEFTKTGMKKKPREWAETLSIFLIQDSSYPTAQMGISFF